MRRVVLIVILVLGLLAVSSWWPPAPALALEGQVNINTATAADFEKLPMVGETKAQAIVRYRQQKGGFTALDELRAVPDVGEATFLAIQPYLTLSGATTLQDKPAAPKRSTSSSRSRKSAPRSAAVAAAPAPAPAVMTQPGQITLLTDQEYYPALRGLLDRAYSSVDVVMFLFKTTGSSRNLANRLVEDLIAVKRRGVVVTLVLEKSNYDPELNRENAAVGARLAKEGVRVRYDSPKTTTHAKLVVVDRRYCLIGSHNFTGAALGYNHEASLLVDSQALAGQLLAYMGSIQ